MRQRLEELSLGEANAIRATRRWRPPSTVQGVMAALALLTTLAASSLPLVAEASDGVDLEQPAVQAPSPTGRQLNVMLTNGLPAALGTGLSTGLSMRWLQPGLWTWGGEVSGATATEYGASWQVAHLDLRARGLVGAQVAQGRSRLAALLGLGVTAVRENRLRQQGERLGLTGEALEQTAWGALASADLMVVVTVPVVGPWAAVVAAGPALHLGQNGVAAGWTAQLGVGWLP